MRREREAEYHTQAILYVRAYTTIGKKRDLEKDVLTTFEKRGKMLPIL